MRLVNAPDVAAVLTVALSRKNVEGLLAQLDQGGPALIQRVHDGILVTVTAEENDAHYGDRLSGRSGPGQVYMEAHS